MMKCSGGENAQATRPRRTSRYWTRTVHIQGKVGPSVDLPPPDRSGRFPAPLASSALNRFGRTLGGPVSRAFPGHYSTRGVLECTGSVLDSGCTYCERLRDNASICPWLTPHIPLTFVGNPRAFGPCRHDRRVASGPRGRRFESCQPDSLICRCRKTLRIPLRQRTSRDGRNLGRNLPPAVAATEGRTQASRSAHPVHPH